VERGDVVYVSELPLAPVWHEWRLALRDFVPTKGSQMKRQVDLARVESLRVALRPMNVSDDGAIAEICEVHLESVSLQPMVSLWRTTTAAPTDPVVIFDPESDWTRLGRRAVGGYQEQLVSGRTKDQLALRIGVERFGRWVQEVSWRHWFGARVRQRGEAASLFDTMTLTIRAGAEGTDAAQLALADESGRSWGTVIPLTREWRQVRVPLASLSPLEPPQVPRPWPMPRGEREDNTPDRGTIGPSLEIFQTSFGPGLFSDQEGRPGAVELERVALEISRRARVTENGQNEQ
jgi:hypothetical protein